MTTGRELILQSDGGSLGNRAISVAVAYPLGVSFRLFPFLVGFYFSFRSVTALVMVRLFVQEARVGAGLNLALSFLFLLAAIFQSIGPSRLPLKWLFEIKSFRWVLAFLLISGSSLAWSGTVSLPESSFYWCGLVADVALVVAMLRVAAAIEVGHSVMKGFVCSTSLLALIAWCMPNQTDLRLGDLEYFNTNQIGNLCAFAIFQAQYLMCRKDGKWRAAILFLVVTLVRSLSKTTLIAFLVSEALLVIREKSLSRRSKLAIAGSTVILVMGFWGLFQSYYDVYSNAGNQAQTLTGRIGIWSYSLEAALEKPWLGNGFDSMWKVVPPFGPDLFEARHAENELLQQFYAYGVVGIVVLVGLYRSLYRDIRSKSRGAMRTIFNCLLLFILVRGLAEAEPFDLLLPLWAITLIGAILSYSQPSNAEVGMSKCESAV